MSEHQTLNVADLVRDNENLREQQRAVSDVLRAVARSEGLEPVCNAVVDAVTRLCDGDALGLARWRDRLLNRLRDRGPVLDLDEPSFLRFHGTTSADRFQTARDWLAKARDPIGMAAAMRAAVEAGRLARLAGRIPKSKNAEPSSPQFGLVGT